MIERTQFDAARAKELFGFAAAAYTDASDITGVRETALIVRDCGDHIVVAFQGTENPAEVLTDLEAWRAKLDGASIHEGFYSAWSNIAPALDKKLQALGWSSSKPIYLTGHSLGGALALIAAYALGSRNPARWVAGVYTFGQPRVGDGRFCKNYKDVAVGLEHTLEDVTFRFVNGCDPVPHLPLADFIMGWRHVGNEVYLSDLAGGISNPGWLMQLADAAFACWRFYMTHRDVLIREHLMKAYATKMEGLT